MTNKNLPLVLVAVFLAAVYAIWFTDWFRPKVMRISYTNRNLHPNLRRGNALPNLIFHVSPKIRFTEIKVVPLAGYETNQNVVPLWHLVSDSNSPPMEGFYYGEYIRGMRPIFKSDRAEPLETNLTYRLLITAGKLKGQRDFELK